MGCTSSKPPPPPPQKKPPPPPGKPAGGSAATVQKDQQAKPTLSPEEVRLQKEKQLVAKAIKAFQAEEERIAEVSKFITNEFPFRENEVYGKPTTASWDEYDGAALASALSKDEELGAAPVRLIDARFIVALDEAGGRFLRRQDLPEGAFLDLDRLKVNRSDDRRDASNRLGLGLRIISVSHAWQQPDHPDPKGLNLRLLAQFLKILLARVWLMEDNYSGGGTWGVFFDFMSLHQKGIDGSERPENEAKLFSKALSNMMSWYSHPHILTLKLTKLPTGYPSGFTFPPGTTPNTAGYFDRGWCFCESTVSNMVKDAMHTYDLGNFDVNKYKSSVGIFHSQNVERCKLPEVTRQTKNELQVECAAQRGPPLATEEFRAQLAEKRFTSPKGDAIIVGNLYQDTFDRLVRTSSKLSYEALEWGDSQMVLVSKVAAAGALLQLMELNVSQNKIGDEGAISLASNSANLPQLATLNLSANQIGDKGAGAIFSSFKWSSQLQVLSLEFNKVEEPLMAVLAKLIVDGASGLKWRNIGTTKPTKPLPRAQGVHPGFVVELKNEALSNALAQKTDFTQQEWDSFGVEKRRFCSGLQDATAVEELTMNTFVLSGGSYFQPREAVLPKMHRFSLHDNPGSHHTSVKEAADRARKARFIGRMY